jgi:hypothetical protein
MRLGLLIYPTSLLVVFMKLFNPLSHKITKTISNYVSIMNEWYHSENNINRYELDVEILLYENIVFRAPGNEKCISSITTVHTMFLCGPSWPHCGRVFTQAPNAIIYLINTAELICACKCAAAKEFEYALGARREKAITTHSAWLDVLNY